MAEDGDDELEWVRKLFRDYGYSVHQRCLRRLGSVQEADDALQDVFVRVLRYRQSFNGDRPLAWLGRIADRVCYDRWRRRADLERPIDPERVERMVSSVSIDTMDRAILIAQLASGARPDVREVGALYYVDEMTQEEIAAHLGISRKVVRSRLESFNRWVKKRLAHSEGGVS